MADCRVLRSSFFNWGGVIEVSMLPGWMIESWCCAQLIVHACCFSLLQRLKHEQGHSALEALQLMHEELRSLRSLLMDKEQIATR